MKVLNPEAALEVQEDLLYQNCFRSDILVDPEMEKNKKTNSENMTEKSGSVLDSFQREVETMESITAIIGAPSVVWPLYEKRKRMP